MREDGGGMREERCGVWMRDEGGKVSDEEGEAREQCCPICNFLTCANLM